MSFADILFEGTFAGVPLDIVDVSDDEGRSVPAHEHPHVDGAETEDLGGRPRVTRLRLIFFPRREDDFDFWERYKLLRDVKERGEVQEFVHPFDGGWDARISDWSVSSNPDAGAIFVDVTLVEHRRIQSVFIAGPGTPLLSGLEEVKVSAADADAALADAGAGSDVPSGCVGAVEGWQAEDVTPRRVNLEMVKLSNDISKLTDDLELAANPRSWNLVRTLAMLNYNVRRAARIVTAKTPRLIEVTVGATSPLLVIAGQIYGASQAQWRYGQMLELNDVHTPQRVEAGTKLKAQSPRSRTRLRQP